MSTSQVAELAKPELVISISCQLSAMFVDWGDFCFRIDGAFMRNSISNRGHCLAVEGDLVPFNGEDALERCWWSSSVGRNRMRRGGV